MLNKQVEELRNTHPNTKEWTQEQRLDFFKNNKKLIYACINKYNSRSSRSKIGYDNEDLFQEASLAFWGLLTYIILKVKHPFALIYILLWIMQ